MSRHIPVAYCEGFYGYIFGSVCRNRMSESRSKLETTDDLPQELKDTVCVKVLEEIKKIYIPNQTTSIQLKEILEVAYPAYTIERLSTTHNTYLFYKLKEFIHETCIWSGDVIFVLVPEASQERGPGMR